MSERRARRQPASSGDKNGQKRTPLPSGDLSAHAPGAAQTAPSAVTPLPNPFARALNIPSRPGSLHSSGSEASPQSGRAANLQHDRAGTQPASGAGSPLSRVISAQSSQEAVLERPKDPYRHKIMMEILREKTKLKAGDEYLSLVHPNTKRDRNIAFESPVENEILRRGGFLLSEAKDRIERLEKEFKCSYHPALSSMHATAGVSYAPEINEVLQRVADPEKRRQIFSARLDSLTRGRLSTDDQKNLYCEYIQATFDEKMIIEGTKHLATANPSRETIPDSRSDGSYAGSSVSAESDPAEHPALGPAPGSAEARRTLPTTALRISIPGTAARAGVPGPSTAMSGAAKVGLLKSRTTEGGVARDGVSRPGIAEAGAGGSAQTGGPSNLTPRPKKRNPQPAPKV